jgi:hypothetical protein
VDFLYFPENKAEYIPGFIWFGIGLVLAVVTTYLLIKYSKTSIGETDDDDVQSMESTDIEKSKNE